MKTSHWYDKTGAAVFEVPRASGGGMRPTTLADARKLGLLPSVTTILGVIDKPQLSDWRVKQAIQACYDNRPTGTLEDYTRAMQAKSEEQVGDAADLGTSIHAALESAFAGEDYDPALAVYVKPTLAKVDAAGIRLLQHELRLVSPYGYAGTTDAVMVDSDGRQGILDFKSRKTKPGQKCLPWETEPMQIAAYGAAQFGAIEGLTGANVYISTTEPGRVEIVTYTADQLTEAWEAFLAALNLWSYLKGYQPSIQ
jgi:hypothetical protein